MSIKVEIEGLSKLQNYFKDYVIRKKNALLGVVAFTSSDIEGSAISKAPRDLGELKSGIRSTVIEKKTEITGDVLSSTYYSAYVEFGTRPHRPPYSALDGWSKRHGIPTGAVVEKIAREGTPAQPFMTPAALENKNKFVRNIINVMSTK